MSRTLTVKPDSSLNAYRIAQKPQLAFVQVPVSLVPHGGGVLLNTEARCAFY
jgi:hypothetical protein